MRKKGPGSIHEYSPFSPVTMKILWFVNIPLEAVNRRLGRPTVGGGFWMHALLEPLVRSGEVQLAVVTATPGDPAYHFTENEVEYYNIPQNRVLESYDLFQKWRFVKSLERAASIIGDWKPDLIHVHGTERFFGLVRARGLTQRPTAVSIQGIVKRIYPVAYGIMTWREIIQHVTLYDIMHAATPWHRARRFRRQIPFEREIFRGVDAVIGRTDWDRCHSRAIAPDVPYFHVDDMIRPSFWASTPWSLQHAQRGVIMTTSGPQPLKGLPVLFRAISILRRWGHDVHLKIAGTSLVRASPSGTVRYLVQLLHTLGIDDHVEMLGWQDGPRLAAHMLSSHCFVVPSLIENGCDALSEAQLIGMPCVASHTGGMSTTVADQQTGLLFSPADSAMLARQLERLFDDDRLAQELGRGGREEARKRHEPTKIVQDLLKCYRLLALAGSGR